MRSFRIISKVIAFPVVFCILAGTLNYFLEPARTTTRIVMHELYTGEEEITTLLVGASRVRRGIDPYMLDEQLGGNHFMLSFGTQTPIDSYFMTKEALKTNTPELVILDVSYRTLTALEERPSDLIWAELKPSLDKLKYLFAALPPEKYLSTLFPVLSEVNREIILADDYDAAENLRKKQSQVYKEYAFSNADSDKSTYAGKGFIYVEEPMVTGSLGDVTFAHWKESKIDPAKLKYFNMTIELCQEKGIPVILIDLPLPYASLEGQKYYDDYLAYMTEYAASYGIPLFNFGFLKTEVFARSDSYFFDRNHMTLEGAQAFTPLLAEVIKGYRQGDLDISEYLYGSYEELLADNPHIFNTWLTETKNQTLTAKAHYGTGVTPEYRFMYRLTKEETYQVIRDYDEDPKIDISEYTKGYIRVYCRPVGSDSDGEQYNSITIKK